MTTTDFLIVGQGLAGSLLAWELLRRKCRVVIVDNGIINASRVAAGLINPITGQRLVKSQDIEYFLTEARQSYRQIGECFRSDFYLEKPMIRIFTTRQEYEICLKRMGNPEYRSFLGNLFPPFDLIDGIKAPFGILEQLQTGYLRIQHLLNTLRQSFLDNRILRQEAMNYEDVTLTPQLKWRSLRPGCIIFCEGYLSARNPWFSYLPLQPVKGEILTLRHNMALPENILNCGHWLLPLDRKTIRIGATFDHQAIDTGTTVEARTELIDIISRIVPEIKGASVLDHQAGIRPATSDRAPLIGLHPLHSQLGIFNGFGARGSLLIPGYSRLFADYLLKRQALPKSCSIARFGLPHVAD